MAQPNPGVVLPLNMEPALLVGDNPDWMLEQALLDFRFKDKEAANLHLQVNKHTYKDICAPVEDFYGTLFDRIEWPPACHVCNSKAPPAAFGNLANAQIIRAEVLNQIQAKPSTNGGNDIVKKGLFHNCNKHFSTHVQVLYALHMSQQYGMMVR